MEFLVIAMDGTDEGALDRRMAVRPAHLEGIETMKAEGAFIVAGAILDEEGNPIGSVEILDYPNRAAVEARIAEDPYSKGNVWQDITIRPFRAVR